MSKSAEPFYFKFNTADWLTGTSGLSAAERGVYITLLALIYDNDGPIFRDDGRLARKCGLPTMPFKRALEGLLLEGKLFVQDDGLLHNYRAKNEIATRQNSGVAKASAGRLGGKKTQEKQRSSSSKAQAENKLVIANSSIIDTNVSINIKSALEILSECLPKETAAELIAHRKALKAPLTAGAAKGLVKAFTAHGNPQAAAEAMMANGWRGFKADWMQSATNTAKPKERDLRSVPDNLLSVEDYWKKRKQQKEWA